MAILICIHRYSGNCLVAKLHPKFPMCYRCMLFPKSKSEFRGENKQ